MINARRQSSLARAEKVRYETAGGNVPSCDRAPELQFLWQRSGPRRRPTMIRPDIAGTTQRADKQQRRARELYCDATKVQFRVWAAIDAEGRP
jgi:hypothetical protein